MAELTPGRVVLYKLAAHDAELIQHSRAREGLVSANAALPGDVYPAIVVRVWNPTSANLQVLLDGTDSYWATSRTEGSGDGQWAWPALVKAAAA